MPTLATLIILFFVIALIYSSVGFGGGSSYIAMLLLMGGTITDIRFTALLCNIIVVSGSSFIYYKNGYLKPKLLLPIIVWSVPFAFIGGLIDMNSSIFYCLAGIILCLVSLLIFVKVYFSHIKIHSLSMPQLSGLSAAIGFISGLIGIGGGIFLSPILHLTNWEKPKIISATASFFILVNSLAAIIGLSIQHGLTTLSFDMFYLAIAVFFGGQLGNSLNLHYFSGKWIHILTACLVAFVGARIILQQINTL